MATAFDELVERARAVRMTPSEWELQRLSYAYGTTKIENDRITKEIVERASKESNSERK